VDAAIEIDLPGSRLDLLEMTVKAPTVNRFDGSNIFLMCLIVSKSAPGQAQIERGPTRVRSELDHRFPTLSS